METKLKKYIDHYVSSSNVDYSILIDSSWGAGKTFSIQEYMQTKKTQDYIYYSVKGKNDISAIISDILLDIILKFDKRKRILSFIRSLHFISEKVYNIFDSKLSGKIYKATSLLTDTATLSYLNTITGKINSSNRIVLFIDDIERFSNKESCVIDLIAELDNYFVSTKKIKIVYIANQDEIFCNEQTINNNKIAEKYKNEKERYIRFTYNFFNNRTDIFNKFILKKFQKKDLSNNQYLFDVLYKVFDGKDLLKCNQDSKKSPNLRTVQFVLDLFGEMKHLWEKLKPVNNYLNPNFLFYSLCVYSRLIKEEGIDRIYLLNNLPVGLKKTEDKFLKSFFEIYENDSTYILCKEKFLIDFICTGLLEDEQFKNIIRVTVSETDPLQQIANDISTIETPELENLLDQVISQLKAHKYSINQGYLLVTFFIKYVRMFDKYKEVNFNQLFKESFFSEENQKELKEYFDYRIENPYFDTVSFDPDIDKVIEDEFNKYKSGKIKDELSEMWEVIKNGDTQNDIFNRFDMHILFSSLEKNDYYKKIPELSNKSLHLICLIIKQYILTLGNAYAFYTSEIPSLNRLKKLLESKVSVYKENDLLRVNKIKELISLLQDAITHIEESKNDFN